jgi:hypothetical protein
VSLFVGGLTGRAKQNQGSAQDQRAVTPNDLCHVELQPLFCPGNPFPELNSLDASSRKIVSPKLLKIQRLNFLSSSNSAEHFSIVQKPALKGASLAIGSSRTSVNGSVKYSPA